MPRQSAQDLAYTHLLEEIVAGRLAAGARIKPEIVAGALGVSRMPVREALRQLDTEGFVTIRPNRGATVTELASEEVQEFYEMRSVLEGLAARLSAARATPYDIEDLDAHVAAMRRAVSDPARWVERHEAFHERLGALSGRPRLNAEIRRLRLTLRPFLRLYAEAQREPEALGHEHEVLVDALRDGDGALAERLAIAHVLANARSLVRLLSADHTKREARPVVEPG
ncbi:MAG: transcriptional regulator [Roseomonas sp.]|jgi:DNA-binding GntR family transcriptional regulator|nr:transcriptional regulator [Roseomonas sp.]